MAAITFREAPEVKEVAEDLIRSYHRHLDGVRIEYVFRSKHARKNGKIVMGCCRLVTGLNAFLATDEDDIELGNLLQSDEDDMPKFFVIEIAEDIWKDADVKVRTALVDHELCHAWQEDGELSILPHDVEEFSCIVKRYGLWKGDVEAFVRTGAQFVLPLDDQPDERLASLAGDFAAVAGACSVSMNGKTVTFCPLDADSLVEEAAYWVVAERKPGLQSIQARFQCGKDRATRIRKALSSLGVLGDLDAITIEVKPKSAKEVQGLIAAARKAKGELARG